MIPTTSGSGEPKPLVPGTVHLIDVEGVLAVQKAKGAQSNIILQPQPSTNPNDPLRWSRRKKALQFALLWMWGFLQAVTVNWNGPVWTTWTVELNCSFMELNISSALCFLALGIGCVILQPMGMKWGRRSVYLLCTILAIAANVLGSQAKNIQMIYGVSMLGGIAASTGDTLMEVSTTDVYFQHERAQYFSWLIFALYSGSYLGPVACGYIVESLSWEWCFYFQVIFFSVIFIVQLFAMEDTSFDIERVHIIPQENGTDMDNKFNEDEKFVGGLNNEPVSLDSETESDSGIDVSIPLRSYWKRLQFIDTEYTDKRSWGVIFIRPFYLMFFPIVVWVGLIFGAQMMWLSLLVSTQSLIFANEPYKFSDSSVGLINLGPFIGTTLGMIYGGVFVDWITIKFTERNQGLLEPEFRLWTMILPTILNAAGLIAYGLGSESGVHWIIPAGIGGVTLGFAMSSATSISITFCVDCYPNLAGECLVLVSFLRCCVGCGFTFAIQPWIDRNGLQVVTWLMFMISLVVNGSFVLMILWGKQLRVWTTEKYNKYSATR